jgi:RNase H-fold protein (predicted Holliday junction resolvase)
MSGNLFCGLDPGREKFGLAVGSGGSLAFSAIVPISLIGRAIECVARADFSNIAEFGLEGEAKPGLCLSSVFLGGGTGFRAFAARLDETGVSYSVVDEGMTTLEGRSLYWRLHPPRGLWRLLPVSLRVPPRPIDDMAAWAILIRASEARTL